MDGQQIIVFLIIAAASVYLGRYVWQSVRALVSGKEGCATGCGKCAYAPKNLDGKPISRPSGPNIIPLGEVRSLPHKTHSGEKVLKR